MTIAPDLLLTAGLPHAMIDAIQEWADRNSVSPSEALRYLIETGLAVSPPEPRRSPCSIPLSELNASNDV